jgi:hypothetical protein
MTFEHLRRRFSVVILSHLPTRSANIFADRLPTGVHGQGEAWPVAGGPGEVSSPG